MTTRLSRILVAALAAAAALPATMASPPSVASAQTSDGAIVGVMPGWNLGANDTSVGPDLGTIGSCNPGGGLPSTCPT